MVGYQLLASDFERLLLQNPDFRCQTCEGFVREPMQAPCGHRFCRSCLENMFQNEVAVCPMDDEEFYRSQVFPDNFLRHEVESSVVQCTFKDDNCCWIGEVRHLEKHQRDYHGGISKGASADLAMADLGLSGASCTRESPPAAERFSLSLFQSVVCRTPESSRYSNALPGVHFPGESPHVVSTERSRGERSGSAEQTVAQQEIEMLRAQLSFYKEDFNRERKDRIALEAKLQRATANLGWSVVCRTPKSSRYSNALPGVHFPGESPHVVPSERSRGEQSGSAEQTVAQQEIEQLRAQLGAYEAAFHEERQDRMNLEAKVKNLEQNFEGLKRQIAQRALDHEQLQGKVPVLERQDLERNVEGLKRQIAQRALDHEQLQGKVQVLERQLGDQSDSFKIFQDEYLAEREQGYDNGRMESALVQSCLDHLQARQDDLRNSHAGLQASQADLQASHADLQGQVRRLQGERPQGPNGEGQ